MASNERREQLVQTIREMARDLSGVSLETITADASFLELGFDSLFLTQLSSACQKAFGVRITFRQLFSDLKSVSALGAYLEEKLPANFALPAAATSTQKPAQHTPVPAPVAAPVVAPVLPASVHVPLPASQPAPVAAMALPSVAFDQPMSSIPGMEGVLLQQLDLMAAQLRFLRGLPADAATAMTIPQTAAIPSVDPTVQAPVATIADTTASLPLPTAPVETTSATTSGEPKGKEQSTVKMPSGFGPSGITSAGSQPLPVRQQKHLEKLIRHYTQRTAGSKDRTQRYRSRLADPRTAAGFSPLWKELVYPIWVQRSSGSKLWDVDGNEYIDLLNGFGPIFLGHAPSFVTKALEEQLSRGFEVGPQTPLVGEVAEMICQLTGMDRASFTCSGSEAVQAAMRLSRTYTGRDKVVVFSRDYHGNFDQVLVRPANRDGQLRTAPSAPGIPFQSVDDTYVLEYGTEESLDIIKKYAAEIAAVIVEPVQSRRPDFQPKEFLHELRRFTREAGIVLVFDEVVTGFRCGPGGAQAHFGIEADLATYGKVIGGGMPIGVVAGRSSLMDIFDGGFWNFGDASFPEAGVTFFAGTFIRHPLTIAAAHATLKYLIQEGPALQQRVSDRAGRFADRVNALFKKYELKIELPRFTSQMYLRNEEHTDLAPLLGTHLRYRGVHILEGFPCYMTDAHSEEDVEHLVRAFTDSVEAMVEDGIFGNPSKLPTGDQAELRWYSAPAVCASMPELPGPTVATLKATEYSPTDLQREMWIAARMRPEASGASNGTNVVELTGEIKVAALETAIAQVVKRHGALRSTFSEDGTKVIVHSTMEIPLRCHDLTELAAADAAFKLAEILEDDARQIFDLTQGPLASFQLITLDPNKHLFVFTAQMIICDGWGFKVALEEIGKFYSASVEGTRPALDFATQMEQYAAWQANDRESLESKETERFWLSHFSNKLPPTFDLQTENVRPRIRTYDAARYSLRLSPQLYQSVKRAAREAANTPFALLLTSFSTWLYRLSGKQDFAVGVPFAGQSELGFDQIVGQCVHTLPFRFNVKEDRSFAEELSRTQKMILDGQEHWRSNLGALIQKLNIPNDPSRIPLAPVIFNLDPALSGVHFSGCKTHITSGPRFYFHYDLGFNLVDEGETLLVECDYNTTLFDDETIRYWIAGFKTLLESITENPNQTIGQIPMLSEEGRPKISKRPKARVSSKSLSEDQSVQSEYVAPRSGVEENLAHIWTSTLGIDRISGTANFFELGGQSLQAVSLFAKIEETFGKKLPLATLFSAPTIQALAKVLEGEGGSSWSPLVAINPNGSRPPLFLVHGAGGNILLYRSLAEHLAPHYPLYGLQSKGLDGTEPLHTIEEMADCYVRELKSVQPRGPYYLGGYCLGGTIAYEMAQILTREGEEVPLVAMLDTYNYSLALKVSFRSFLYQKAKFHLANMGKLRPGDMFEYLREKVRLGFGGELANLKTSMPGSSRGDGVCRAESGAEAAVQSINDYAAEHYNPQPYPGCVTLFKPRINYKFYPDPNMGWGDLAASLDIVEVAENPHSMLLEPYVKVLAQQLKERIDHGTMSDRMLPLESDVTERMTV